MEIQQTKDYSKFETINGNRSLNQNKIQKIVNDINNGFNMLPYCPVIVSKNGKNFQIIDGQHRVEISKLTENPVYFVVCETLTLQQIAILNSRGEKWTLTDFMECYIKLGIKDYQDIKMIMNKYKINARVVVDLLMFNKHAQGRDSTEFFQSGQFKSNYLEETEELLKLVSELFSRYTFSSDRYLIGAVQKIKEKGICDFDVLKDKIAAWPMGMDKQTDVKNYIYNIEKVYNYKNSLRKTII